MRVVFAHLCDYALISNNGKLSVLGIFGRLSPPKLPFVLPQCYLAFEIELNYAEANREFELEIHLVDADGHKLLNIDARLNVRGQGKPGDRPRLGQAIALHNVPFERPGIHNWNIFLNKSLATQLELMVEPQTGPAPGPGAQGGAGSDPAPN